MANKAITRHLLDALAAMQPEARFGFDDIPGATFATLAGLDALTRLRVLTKTRMGRRGQKAEWWIIDHARLLNMRDEAMAPANP